MIKFKQACELEIVETYDEDADKGKFATEKFKAGDLADGEILDVYRSHSDIQFADGSVAFEVSNELFEKV